MISPWVGVIGIVLVGGVAMMLRRGRGSEDETVRMPAEDGSETSPMPAGARGAHDDAFDDEDEEDDDEVPASGYLALTSDGHAFAEQGYGVVIAPKRHFLRSRPAGDDGTRMTPDADPEDMQPPIMLAPGDLIAARVVRGSPDLDPWRLEMLGRDRDLVVWPFETQDAAETAHALLERRIVKAPRDRDGDVVTVTDHDFEEAQAELERAMDALNAPTEDDEIPPPPGRGDARR